MPDKLPFSRAAWPDRASAGPQPIPIEGVAQVFANEECTEYPTVGREYNDFYVRLNRSFAFDDAISLGGGQMAVSTPISEAPDDPFYVRLYDDYFSPDRAESFSEGEVVQCHSDEAFSFLSSYLVVFNE